MVKSIMLEGQTIEEAGILILQLDRKVEIRILAEEARRIANRFVHMEISTQMHAKSPMLVIGEADEAVWRVPIHLTFPAFGDVGCVGFSCTLTPQPALSTRHRLSLKPLSRMPKILLPVSHRQQRTQADCLPVCVKMVLDY